MNKFESNFLIMGLLLSFFSIGAMQLPTSRLPEAQIALGIAVRTNDVDAATTIINNNPDININFIEPYGKTDATGTHYDLPTVLMWAAFLGNRNLVHLLLKARTYGYKK